PRRNATPSDDPPEGPLRRPLRRVEPRPASRTPGLRLRPGLWGPIAGSHGSSVNHRCPMRGVGTGGVDAADHDRARGTVGHGGRDGTGPRDEPRPSGQPLRGPPGPDGGPGPDAGAELAREGAPDPALDQPERDRGLAA